VVHPGRERNGDPEAFRFLEDEIPADAVVALDVPRNTYLYPAWDAGLRRTVVFVPESGGVPDEAGWLVVGPGRALSAPERGARTAPEVGDAGAWRV